MDVSRDALKFMEWSEGTLGGFDARVFRISFSGELSFEIAVPAGPGPRLLGQAAGRKGPIWALCLTAPKALHISARREGLYHDRR